MELDGVLGGRLREGDEIAVSYRPDAGKLVRIEGSKAAARSRVKLSLLDLPFLPGELLELLPAELRDRKGEDAGEDPPA
jgi:NAD+ kinase